MRKSTVFTKVDDAGEYESEVFDCKDPKSVVICSHGNGVKRWDGEKFFYNVAEHYPDHAFYLVDQNQDIEGGCQLNDLGIMINRLQNLIAQARQDHPSTPIVLLCHSMGCGVASFLSTDYITRMLFVAPAAGDVLQLMIERYGKDIINGGEVRTKDGLGKKVISKEYVESIGGVIWEEKYKELLENFAEIFVYEAGSDQILSEERRAAVRILPFKQYTIIEGAPHDFDQKSLEKLYKEIDFLI